MDTPSNTTLQSQAQGQQDDGGSGRNNHDHAPSAASSSTASPSLQTGGRRRGSSLNMIPPLLSGSSPPLSSRTTPRRMMQHHPNTTVVSSSSSSSYSSPILPPSLPILSPLMTSGPYPPSSLTAPTLTGPSSPSPSSSSIPMMTPQSPSPLISNNYSSSSSSHLEKSQQAAMDAALLHEKQRIEHLQEQEKDYTTIDEFKMALKRERQHSKHLAMELASLKCVAVTSTLEAEMHEEGRINCLMRRLDGLQKEKGRIILELEREEEMVSV